MDHPSCKTENQLFTCVSVAHLLLSLNNGLAVGSSCSPLLSLWWAVDTQDLLIRDFDVFCSAGAVLATPQLESMIVLNSKSIENIQGKLSFVS